MTCNFTKPKVPKKTSMPDSVKSLGYIKRYISSRPRPVKSHSNSIRHNCHNICIYLFPANVFIPYLLKALQKFSGMSSKLIFQFFTQNSLQSLENLTVIIKILKRIKKFRWKSDKFILLSIRK